MCGKLGGGLVSLGLVDGYVYSAGFEMTQVGGWAKKNQIRVRFYRRKSYGKDDRGGQVIKQQQQQQCEGCGKASGRAWASVDGIGSSESVSHKRRVVGISVTGSALDSAGGALTLLSGG